MAFWKESMINRLSNLINRNRSAAKISQVLCSTGYPSLLLLHLLDVPNSVHLVVVGHLGRRVDPVA